MHPHSLCDTHIHGGGREEVGVEAGIIIQPTVDVSDRYTDIRVSAST